MKKGYVAVVWFIACIFVLFAFSSVSAKEDIRIGFSISLTGPYTSGAADQMRAYELWLEEVNSRGGIFVKEFNKKLPVKFVYYDDKSDMGTAVRVYEKLMTDDKVDLLLTPFSTTIVFAVIPIADKYKMPMLGATASSTRIREIKTEYFWFITPCQPDKVMSTLVDFLSAQNLKKVAVIYVQDHYQRECLEFLTPALKKANLDTVLQKDYPFGEKDLTTLLFEVKKSEPDAVIALNAYVESVLIMNQAKTVNLEPKVLFSLLGPAGAFYVKALGPTSDGIMTMGQWNPKINWPGAKQFYENFIAKFKTTPNFLDAILAYQECQIMEQAVEKAGSLSPAKIRDMINKEEFLTAGGPVKFTGRENYRTPAMIDQLQNGEHEIVWPPEYVTAKPIIPKPAWK
jgi:branched-chain amino acid transport system substrate-binding protein